MSDLTSDLQGTISVSQKQSWHNLLKNGELKKVIELVEPYLAPGEHEELCLTLITDLASFVQNEHSAKVNCENIYTLFSLCCKSLKIEELTKLKYGFLISSHYVLRFFIDQDQMKEALDVSSQILKTKKRDLDDRAMNVYYSNFYYLHSVNKKSNELSCILEIVNHSLGHLRYCGSKFLCLLLTKAQLIPVKPTDEQDKLSVIKFQLNILELSHKGGAEAVNLDVNSDELVVSFMGLMTTIVKDYLSMNKFADVKFAVSSTVSAMRSWLFDDAMIRDCTEFLQTMLNMLSLQSYCLKDIQKCSENLDLLYAKYIKNKTFCVICVVISQVASHMYFKPNSKDDGGNYNLDAASQKAVCELLLHLSEVISKCNTVDCKCKQLPDEVCVIKSDTISSFQLKLTILHCIVTSFINKADGLETLLPLTEKVLQSAAKRVGVLKKKNCAKWLEMWQLTGKNGIILASYCYVAQMYQEAKKIVTLVVVITLHFGDEAVSVLEEPENYLTKGFELLMNSYWKLEKLRGALNVAAIAFKVLPPRSRKNMFKNWVKVKNACSDKLKKYTLFDICTQDKRKIKLFCKDFDINTLDMAELLVLEMEAYNNLGVMNLECMNAAHATLLTLPSVDWLQKARALLVYFPFVWSHHTLKECVTTIASLNEVIEGVSNMENMEGKMLCILGHLYFYKFCCKMKVARLKQQQDISSCNLNSTEERELGEMPDPNDNCDVNPTYFMLNIENESNLLKHLKSALKNWTEALCKGYNKDDGYTPLSNLEIVSYYFHLYGYDREVISTWCLYYKFSQTLGDAEATLKGLCHLLEYCTCQTSKCSLLAEAERIFSEMKLREKDDIGSQLLYLNFYLASAQHCFTNKHYSMLPTYLEVLSDAVNSKRIRTFGALLVNARIRFLITQCKLLSDPFIHWPGRTNSPVVKEAKDTYIRCSYLLKQDAAPLVEYLQIQCLMLEVSLWMGQLFLEMLWPRESRCCMRKLLKVSQSLSLSTRTAQFLDLLAQVDVICSQVDDGLVKLHGLQLILQLENKLEEDSSKRLAETSNIDAELANCLEQLTIERTQMSEFLRSPRMKMRSPKCMSSPQLRKATFIMPDFVHHDDNCTCPVCNTLMLQNLILDTIYLQAQIYNIQSETREALKYFIGGIHMRQLLSQKHTRWMKRFHSELQSISSDETIVNLKPRHILLPGYIWLSLAYADFLAARNAYSLAQDMNKTAIQQLEFLESKHPHLMKHVTHQQICIMQAAKVVPTPKKVPNEGSSCLILLNDVPTDQTPVSPSYRSVKLQKSTHKVTTEKEHFETPARIQPRKFLLFESDEETEKENTKSQLKKKQTTERRTRNKKPETKQTSQVKVKIWKDDEDSHVSTRTRGRRRLLSESQANSVAKIWKDAEEDSQVSTRTRGTRRLLSESQANSVAKSSGRAKHSKATANLLQ